MRINRNIVECKAMLSALCFLALYCINRNIVECKARYILSKCQAFLVLIETLWNVKNTFAFVYVEAAVY